MSSNPSPWNISKVPQVEKVDFSTLMNEEKAAKLKVEDTEEGMVDDETLAKILDLEINGVPEGMDEDFKYALALHTEEEERVKKEQQELNDGQNQDHHQGNTVDLPVESVYNFDFMADDKEYMYEQPQENDDSNDFERHETIEAELILDEIQEQMRKKRFGKIQKQQILGKRKI